MKHYHPTRIGRVPEERTTDQYQSKDIVYTHPEDAWEESKRRYGMGAGFIFSCDCEEGTEALK